MRIVDPHLHLWDQRGTPRRTSPLVKLLGWRPDLMYAVAERVFPRDLYSYFGRPEYVAGDYLGPDYLRDTESRELAACVHVQAGWERRGPMAPVGETRWLQSLEIPQLRGIVGFADLALGAAVDEVLRAHLDASPHFRGVRYMLAHHPDPGIHSFCDRHNIAWDPKWRAGYEQLARHGLSFDAWAYEHQLGDIAALARDVPEVPVVLCHAGTPAGYAGAFAATGATAGERAEIARRWRDGMARLAEQPNVVVKLSGFVMPVVGWGHHLGLAANAQVLVEQLAPMVNFVIDTFGTERCMFASNFPVDKVSASWDALFTAYETIVAERSEDARRELFFDTAVRTYRLDLD